MTPIVVPGGSSVVVGALEGLTLNGLSLNNGTTHVLTALQLPIPAKKPEWVEGADANGAVLMRDPLVENGTLVATVDLFGTSKDQVNGLIGAIVDELEEADRNPAGVPVVWTPAGGSQSLTFYALEGEVTQLEADLKFVISNVPTVQVTLKCRPGGYGDLVTGPSQTTTGPVVQLTVPDVPGDMPTDEAYVVITDQSSQARRHVEWGAEWLHYNAATSLILDSDSLVTSGYSGTQTTYGAAGPYDPNATGTNVINATVFESAWTSMLSTGSQAHVGTFRVKARVIGSPAAGWLRLSWRAGDGALMVNDPVYVTAPGANPAYREADLGMVTIPAATAGTQSWEGVLQGLAGVGWVTTLWSVDYLVLVPVEAGYGRARGETTPGAGTIAAYDVFGQTAGALNGKTLNQGGTWATSGDATDFQVTGAGALTRNEGGDAAWVGRTAVAGSTNYTDVAAGVTMWGFNLTIPEPNVSGLLLRYVDANNWLGVFCNTGWQASNRILSVYKNIAGTKTLLAEYGTSWLAAMGTAPNGLRLALTAQAGATGTYSAQVVVSNGSLGGTFTLSGSDSALATGGTLATGKPGLYSERSAIALLISFDNFYVSSSPALVPAMYSGRTLEVTGADVRRQNSAGTVYGRPASYRGSRFVLNPEGSAGRTTRVLAKAWRNDVELGTEAAPITDSLKCQVFYRPRYSVVPR